MLAAAPAQTVEPTPPPSLVEAPSAAPELRDPLDDPAAEPAPAPAVEAPPVASELRDPLADPASSAAPVVEAPKTRHRHAKGDPLEGFNRSMFGIHQKLDKALYRPAAMGYKHVVPKLARSGLRNFFVNLTEPIVFVNYLLQLKPGKAARTLARFAVNSTIGVAGFGDVAKTRDFRLPHVDNSFGNTLARYGIGPGPYIFLPFVGPTTLRDILGGPVDAAVLPVAIGNPFDRWEYQLSSTLLTGLDLRAESDDELRALFDGAVDPYATLRSVFLQNRAAEVEAIHPHRHKAEGGELDDPLTDPGASTTPKPSETLELRDPLADPAEVPAPKADTSSAAMPGLIRYPEPQMSPPVALDSGSGPA